MTQDSIWWHWGSQGTGECPAGWMNHSQSYNWDDWHFHSCAYLEWIFYSHSVLGIKYVYLHMYSTNQMDNYSHWNSEEIMKIETMWGQNSMFTEGEILLMARCNLFIALWSCVLLRSIWNLWDSSISQFTLVSQNPSADISYIIDQGLPLLILAASALGITFLWLESLKYKLEFSGEGMPASLESLAYAFWISKGGGITNNLFTIKIYTPIAQFCLFLRVSFLSAPSLPDTFRKT